MKNVQSVLLGKYEVETWYFSPYPDDYSKLDKVGSCFDLGLGRVPKLFALDNRRGGVKRALPPVAYGLCTFELERGSLIR